MQTSLRVFEDPMWVRWPSTCKCLNMLLWELIHSFPALKLSSCSSYLWVTELLNESKGRTMNRPSSIPSRSNTVSVCSHKKVPLISSSQLSGLTSWMCFIFRLNHHVLKKVWNERNQRLTTSRLLSGLTDMDMNSVSVGARVLGSDASKFSASEVPLQIRQKQDNAWPERKRIATHERNKPITITGDWIFVFKISGCSAQSFSSFNRCATPEEKPNMRTAAKGAEMHRPCWMSSCRARRARETALARCGGKYFCKCKEKFWTSNCAEIPQHWFRWSLRLVVEHPSMCSLQLHADWGIWWIAKQFCTCSKQTEMGLRSRSFVLPRECAHHVEKPEDKHSTEQPNTNSTRVHNFWSRNEWEQLDLQFDHHY